MLRKGLFGWKNWADATFIWERRVKGRLLRIVKNGRRLYVVTVYHGDWTLTCARGSLLGAQRAAANMLKRLGTKGIR